MSDLRHLFSSHQGRCMYQGLFGVIHECMNVRIYSCYRPLTYTYFVKELFTGLVLYRVIGVPSSSFVSMSYYFRLGLVILRLARHHLEWNIAYWRRWRILHKIKYHALYLRKKYFAWILLLPRHVPRF